MRLTLGTAVWLFLLALVGVIAGTTWWLDRSSHARVMGTSTRLREAAVDRVVGRVNAYLDQGESVLGGLEQRFNRGECNGVEGAESCLTSALVTHPDFTETSYTTANGGKWQLTVFRASNDRICARHVAFGERSERTWCRPVADLLARPVPDGQPRTLNDDEDPTEYPGFVYPLLPEQKGHVIRSDLSRSQFDPDLIRFLLLYGGQSGVLKVGLQEQSLRQRISEVHVTSDEHDPFTLFVAGPEGELVTGLTPQDPIIELEEAFRADKSKASPEVKRALVDAPRVDREQPRYEGTFDLDGKRFTVSYRLLEQTQGWRVGVVGPDDAFVKDLLPILRASLATQVAVATLMLAFVLVMILAMQRALGRIETETNRMRRFEFAPARPSSPFSDVKEALSNLELAKTAMRALSRFVPVALVRRLFEANQEPTLGSEPRELSMMFTDIEGFTTLVEREEPQALARWLGDYFETMTRAVHAEAGIVDKFIGDAVMALWNAPNPVEHHAVRACAAALRCLRETEALYDSPAWAGRPRLVTRFGLHVADVLVGHFGAPDRVSYTAIGDGVNLASRLEGLNKQFGTRILVSDAIEQRARGKFAFRRLDKVAVKGKSKAVAVYELLGPLDAAAVPKSVVERYEKALDAYGRREFETARALLDDQCEDPPSRVLHGRCEQLMAQPPPAEWDATLHPEK